MDGFTREELARRAGVTVAYVDRLIEEGILRSGEAPVSAGAVRTVRFVHALEQGGLPLEGMGAAVRSGDLSFDHFAMTTWDRFSEMSSKTYRELSAETGLSLDVLQSLREAMGFARPEPDDQVREDELSTVALVQAEAAGGVDPAVAGGAMRVWGEAVRLIAESDAILWRDHIEAPLLRSGLTPSQALHVGAQISASMVPMLDGALLAMYHAHSEHTWMSNVVEGVEATLEKAGLYQQIVQPPAMCFLDLSGYTRLTEERGDQAAAEVAASLGHLVKRTCHEQGGQPVKWLGDGVMVFFRKAGQAVAAGLDMVERASSAGLPPAHAGIDAGPVIYQDGDYFGRTVNLAARIAAHAGPGQLLVSDSVASASSDPAVRFADIGPVELKGVPRPIRLYQASRNATNRGPSAWPASRRSKGTDDSAGDPERRGLCGADTVSSPASA